MKKKDGTEKKDRSIRPAVLFVLIFLLATAIAISIPLYRHRQYVKFTSELSSLTSRAGRKGVVTCLMEGEEYRLSQEASYQIYGKIIFMEMKKHVRPNAELAADGMELTYGLLGGTLILAPAEYDGEEALYVEFHSNDMDYVYLAPQLRYKDFKVLVTGGV